MLKNWTAKAAARYSKTRLSRIEKILEEIAYVYGDVDQSIVDCVDNLS